MVFNLANQYIRHAEQHKNASGIRMEFTQATCEALKIRVDKELVAAEGNRKRIQEVTFIDPDLPPARRARLEESIPEDQKTNNSKQSVPCWTSRTN